MRNLRTAAIAVALMGVGVSQAIILAMILHNYNMPGPPVYGRRVKYKSSCKRRAHKGWQYDT